MALAVPVPGHVDLVGAADAAESAATIARCVDEGGAAVGPLADLQPIDAGHHQVEHYQFRPVLADDIQSALAVGRADDVVTIFFQVIADQFDQIRVVLL